jgi:DNA-binding MurR/RpiR family transcriptional regulator
MVATSLLHTISVYENAFTKSEKILYEFLQTHIDDIIYMSVTELAERIGVGESTILRFCRKVGYKGYQDFKLNVAQYLGAGQLEKQTDQSQSLMEKVETTLINSIKKSTLLIEEETVEAAVDLLAGANRVLFFGVGSSGVAAVEAKHRFMRIGKKYDAYTDSHFMMMMASTLQEDDIVVAFTLSGGTKDTVDACRTARESGAKVIAITSYLKSPITKQADLVLLTSGKEGPFEGGSMFAKVSQLYVIDLLFTYATQRDIDHARHFQNKIAKSITDKSY